MTMSKGKNRAKAKTKIHQNFATVTKKLLELIDRGVTPWHQPWYSIGYQNLLSQKPYSGINPLLCTIDCIYHAHSSPYYVGKTQCNDKGWRIKKGSKANWLRWGGGTTVTEEVKDDRGQVQEKEKFIRAFKWWMVFNIDCIDDGESEIKIKDFLPQLAKVTDPALDVEIQTFVDSLNKDITYTGNLAYHEYRTGKIYMPPRHQFKSRDGFWATLLHELIHSTATELERPICGDMADTVYHQEELIADLGASFLGNHFGLASTELENHASYLKHYWSLLNLDAQAFFKAVYQSQKAANYLLELGGIDILTRVVFLQRCE